MANGFLGIFSDTILQWREPSGGFDFVFLKERGIKQTRGRFPAWSSYEAIQSCSVECMGNLYPVLKFTQRKKRFYFIAPVSLITLPSEISLEAVLGILRFKGIHVLA
ncbi:MAG: hypothetical protein WDM76_06360 [Limisphaerales bacterium]